MLGPGYNAFQKDSSIPQTVGQTSSILESQLVLVHFLIFKSLLPCVRLSRPFRQLLSARKYAIAYRIVSYPSVEAEQF